MSASEAFAERWLARTLASFVALRDAANGVAGAGPPQLQRRIDDLALAAYLPFSKTTPTWRIRAAAAVHNVLCSYTHLHAAATPVSAEGIVRAARIYARAKLSAL